MLKNFAMESSEKYNSSGNEFWYRRRSMTEKTLILLTAILILFCIILVCVVVYLSVTNTPAENQNVCDTLECIRAAARVADGIDFSVNPCGNFYEYACGGWMKSHVIPSDRSYMASFTVLRDTIQVKLKQLLEEDITNTDLDAVVKAKNLYGSCMNTTEIEGEGISVALPLLKEVGGWPILGTNEGGNWKEDNFSLASLIVIINKYSNVPYIYPYVLADIKNKEQSVLYLDNPGFIMPDRTHYNKPKDNPLMKAYVELGVKVAVEFGTKREAAQKDMEDILDLEIILANISTPLEGRRDNEKLYNKFTVGEMKNNLTESDELGFTWFDYVHRLFQLVNFKVQENETVIVKDVEYMRNLMHTLEKFPKRTIANYAVWRLMVNRIKDLPDRFRQYLGEFYKVLYGSTHIRSRWRKCVGLIVNYMGLPLGRQFVERHFDEEAKSGISDMTDYILTAFGTILSELDWMDEETIDVAEAKANAMKRKIGYDDSILDDKLLNKRYENVTIQPYNYFQNMLSLLKRTVIDDLLELRYKLYRMKWETAPSTVNAFYSAEKNRIMFPAGILQPPYYHKDYPRSLNYGGIGTLIGHEITHGFDDRGRQFNKDGELHEWWSQKSVDKFKDLTTCFIDQYGNFSYPEAGGMNVNGIITLGENIADNGGVLQSYRGYRNFISNRGSEEDPLPGLNMTHDQLFFINFAQIRCTLATKENSINHLMTGPHSPSRFRVTGTLQNLPEFSAAFHCPKGSYMNPSHKCRIW
ncbi:neprilysin-like isoform X2 [Saccostrea echinata]|uniref:neprilysin-like isoform X2 n=1 Tax=Saccostrea echinata TaxID=191078 RepID=UPI002A818EA2|nr:neprilysin-like isoform X2 [Saccostrea echinata]